jgi:predicted HAD superfamily Cof-like phosphohydrolase
VGATVVDHERGQGKSYGIQLALDLGILSPITSYVKRVRRRSQPRPQERVAEFHRAFDLHIQMKPGLATVDETLRELRVHLLEEEVAEFRDATAQADLIGIADAIGDILYVAYGAAVTYGIDADAVMAEVHRSNMSKLGPDGRPIRRADGKVLKSSEYQPPNIQAVLFGS